LAIIFKPDQGTIGANKVERAIQDCDAAQAVGEEYIGQIDLVGDGRFTGQRAFAFVCNHRMVFLKRLGSLASDTNTPDD